MRLLDIVNEDVTNNITFINAFTDFIIDKLFPSRMKKGEIVRIHLSNYKTAILKHFGNDRREFLEELCRKTEICFVNEEQSRSTVNGEFIQYHNNQYIVVYVANIMGEEKDITKKEALEHIQDGNAVKTIRSTFAHEFRHAMQTNYSNKIPMGKYDYDADPLERDASFYETLHDFDPNTFDSALSFIKTVVGAMEKKKTLSDRDITHYSRQAGKYYINHKNKNTPHLTPKEKLASKKKEELASIKMSLIKFINNEENASKLGDFRNIDGYDKTHGMFLFDYRVVLSYINKLVASLIDGKELPDNISNLNMCLITLSIIDTIEHSRENHILKNILIRGGASYDGAIASLDNHNSFGRYDKNFIVKCIKDFQ